MKFIQGLTGGEINLKQKVGERGQAGLQVLLIWSLSAEN
jgi:hypothetical protein